MGGKHGQEARRPSWRKNLSSSCGDGWYWLGGVGHSGKGQSSAKPRAAGVASCLTPF